MNFPKFISSSYHDYSLPGGGIDEGENVEADADIIHMISHCYVCEIDDELGETAFEAHNEEVIAHSDKKGLSIERETFILKVIVEQLLVGYEIQV
jgi:hypothetical protein